MAIERSLTPRDGVKVSQLIENDDNTLPSMGKLYKNKHRSKMTLQEQLLLDPKIDYVPTKKPVSIFLQSD